MVVDDAAIDKELYFSKSCALIFFYGSDHFNLFLMLDGDIRVLGHMQ